MNQKLWDIIDRNYQLLCDRVGLMNRRLVELENAAIDRSAIAANTDDVMREITRLREENAILAEGLKEPPGNPYG